MGFIFFCLVICNGNGKNELERGRVVYPDQLFSLHAWPWLVHPSQPMPLEFPTLSFFLSEPAEQRDRIAFLVFTWVFSSFWESSFIAFSILTYSPLQETFSLSV